jgi:hypothetical protein
MKIMLNSEEHEILSLLQEFSGGLISTIGKLRRYGHPFPNDAEVEFGTLCDDLYVDMGRVLCMSEVLFQKNVVEFDTVKKYANSTLEELRYNSGIDLSNIAGTT